ncbi:hypothetical protein E4M02_09655 [Brevundimonas sp. S30B]|uniref:F0F1 ATP synthase subunit B family protein n=1 Tax=unclassified Brevundimonas TaxID=2622653 RepID=UPI0010717CEF|nr:MULTISPECIES: hypothetical protein [unclassified Brevundimonas]QBX38306.1 hypothetical protein E4M01_11400 [Brevundimonas sp. MF30-B]TFW01557.1 hypothetical protein E4M02_09655 [Brevundimonas sp. S30B]
MAAPDPSAVSARNELLPETAVAIREDAVTPSGTDAAAYTASVEHGGEHGSSGLPQLEMQYWAGQIVWLLLIFVVLYLLLSKVFLPRLRAVRDEREGAITSAVSAARAVQAEAQSQAEAASAEVAKARAESRATAAAAKARVTEQANARQAADEAAMNARISEAEAGIAQTRDAAMANVSSIAEDTTRAIVERLTGKDASASELASVKGAV